MSEILLYKTDNEVFRLEVLLKDETIWLPQLKIAELFHTTKQNVGQHFKNIFAEGELVEDEVVKEFFTTVTHISDFDKMVASLERKR